MLSPPSEVLLNSIVQSTNEVTQGWLRLMAAAPAECFAWLAKQEGAASVQGSMRAAYVEKQRRLWSALIEGRSEAVAPADSTDRRFGAAAWRNNAYFDYVRQSYLLGAQYLEALLESSELEPPAKARARFALRQWLDALSPANFAATNPVALEAAIESRGESLARGIANLLADLRQGRLSQSDESAFEVGRNLAVTPGEVIYENELIQLIQYRPSTVQVAERPLVIVPPCINKFYVLDLRPENSFVAYAVGQGHTVFMLSWRNVGPELGHLTWDDYLEKGIFTAFRVAREITGARQVNALGFCVGGTLLGAALAVMAARKDDTVASATFLATMLDFSETGPIGVFVDEASVAAREASIGAGGLLSGNELALVFSSLRANDLVWPYVINNYLLGERPAAFDILYWNADGTNLPGPMYCYYVRNTYLENRLRTPGALVNCGVPVDLGRIRIPVFVLATREDHIVPWPSAYRTLRLVGGDSTFVLGASGHIAGVVNPPASGRRSYWTGGPYPEDPQAWLEGASEQPGSWWPAWSGWLSAHGGGMRAARTMKGRPDFPAIEPAPGRYVKQRINQEASWTKSSS